MLMPLIGLLAGSAGAAIMYGWLRLRARSLVATRTRRGDSNRPTQSLVELQRFRMAVDKCADSIYVIDFESMKFLDATATASSRTGYSYEELMNMGPADLLADKGVDLRRCYQEVIAAGEAGIRSESRGVIKDGSHTWVELHRHALQVDGRTLIVSISRDITERKLAEIAAQRQSRMFAALSATNEAIMRVSSPQELYQRVCEAAVHGGKLFAASVCLPLQDGKGARIAALSSRNVDVLSDLRLSVDESTPEGHGLVGTAFRSRQPCISNDFLNDTRTRPWHELARQASIAAVAALPLIQHGQAVGVLLLHSQDLGAFDGEIVELLNHLARNIVFALDNFARDDDRRRSEAQLREIQGRLDRTTRGGSDGLWELNATTREIWVSPLLAEMMGYLQQDFLADREQFFNVMHLDGVSALRESIEKCIREDVPVDKELRARTKGGEWRWYRVRAAVERDASGRPMTVSGSMRDITDLRHYHKALIEATETAASANRAKSEFLANMSHEIRTPMNGVIGMVELLIETPLNAMQKDYAETVRDSALALLTVINDILDFSKVEAGKLELECLDIDIRDTVEDVARMLAIQAHAKGLEVIALIDPALPDLVCGDAGRLRQVMLNLGGNAVKFTQKGEVAIECRVTSRDEDGITVRCEVRDTGIGIPAARIDALFKAFTQVDSSTTRKFGGTGLGLSIVKRLVELMGGEVGVSSEEAVGSIFWFTAKLGHVKDASALRAAAPIELRGQRILVVDDNMTNRKVLMGQLTLCGMDPVCASSADEALSLMRHAAGAGRAFEVALLDHQMPGVDGATLGATILGDAGLQATRLILLTSSGQRGEGRMFSELGFAGYLLKPVTHRDLTDCLMMVLGVRAETWSMRSQPIVTRHQLRSQRLRDSNHILVAEDNIVNQKVACRLLEKLGYRVDVAGDGQAALSAWQSGRYDLILMDCQMPVMDGYETTRKIREREGLGVHIPIIALTAHAMKGADNECLAAGMDDYLSKPIDRELLQSALLRWLGEADMHDEQAAR